MITEHEYLPQILEAALFASTEPLSIDKLKQLFPEPPETTVIKEALETLQVFYTDRGVELVKVASGYRFQSRQDYAGWLQRLWERKPPRYTRALLETLALIVYQQPITRGEIEAVRGVAVSSSIIKVLQEREWVKVVGYKEVPGKPAMFATTKAFLDYFGLKTLGELPPLKDLVDLDQLAAKLDLELPESLLPDVLEAPGLNTDDSVDLVADLAAADALLSESDVLLAPVEDAEEVGARVSDDERVSEVVEKTESAS